MFNQPAIDIMVSGQITGCVKHVAVPIAMIQEDIKAGNSKPAKIKGTLNPADLGTKPLAGTTLNCHFRQARDHQYCPSPTSEHRRLMQVHLVNQHLTKFDSAAPNAKLKYDETIKATTVYDSKEHNEKE